LNNHTKRVSEDSCDTETLFYNPMFCLKLEENMLTSIAPVKNSELILF